MKAPEIRDPSAATLAPFVRGVRAFLAGAVRGGYRRAVAIVTLDIVAGAAKRDGALDEGARARFFVQVVASDARGELFTPDAPQELVRIAGQTIADDARAGNGRWTRLVLRLGPNPNGPSDDVLVAEVK